MLRYIEFLAVPTALFPPIREETVATKGIFLGRLDRESPLTFLEDILQKRDCKLTSISYEHPVSHEAMQQGPLGLLETCQRQGYAVTLYPSPLLHA